MGQDTIERLRALLDECGLTYGQAALAMGCSPSTVKIALMSKAMPERADARLKLVRFLDTNRGATCRQDIRFV